MRPVFRLFIAAAVAVTASVAAAGPWGALPDAIARLQANPGDASALAVIAEAESAILREAAKGHLAAVAMLMDTYGSLVVQLRDGESRLQNQEARTATALFAWGEGRHEMLPGSHWQTIVVGRANIWEIHRKALEEGGNVRTGLEDAFYLPNGEKAANNAQLIEILAKLVREVGREIASPAEARKILGLKGG